MQQKRYKKEQKRRVKQVVKQMETDIDALVPAIKRPAGVPTSEYSEDFLQGMVNRMGTSFFKYGRVRDAYPHRVDAIKSLMIRLEKYEKTGNTEYLMDAANFAMIEYMHPKHPDAHFKATDSSGSPGRAWKGEVDPSQRANTPERWND